MSLLILGAMFTELLNPRKYYTGVEQFRQLFGIADELPSLEHLTDILRAFSQFPYENLSKILKLNQTSATQIPFRLPDEVISDHADYKLGGTCFSLTFTLKSILDYYGYQTEILMADMKFAPNSHCLLWLHFDGKEYILDPGYLIHRPLELAPNAFPVGIKLTYDMTTDRYELWTAEHNSIKWRYAFRKQPVDWETFGRLWLDSFHWFSMHGLCLSKRDSEGFLYLHNHYIKQVTAKDYIKGNFNEDLGEIIPRYFQIEKELVLRAQKALLENLHNDNQKGYRVPRWVLR